MNTDGTGFHTCKECQKTESLWNHTTTDHKEGEQLEDRRIVGASSCNSGDGTDERVQFLMFMMMMTYSNRHMSNRYYCLPASRQQYLFNICLLLYVQSWTPDDGQKDHLKHVECHSQISKFDTLVHLDGFTIEIILRCTALWMANL